LSRGQSVSWERKKKLTHKREITCEISHPSCINDVSLKFRIMPKWRNVNEHYTQSMELRTIKKNLLLSILDLTVLVSFSKVDNDLMCILTLQGDVQSFFHQFWPHQVVWAHATRMMPDNSLPFLYAWVRSTIYADSTSMIVNMLDKNHFQPTLWHLISSINNNKPINNPKIQQWHWSCVRYSLDE
jgi:hypothetical protein